MFPRAILSEPKSMLKNNMRQKNSKTIAFPSPETGWTYKRKTVFPFFSKLNFPSYFHANFTFGNGISKQHKPSLRKCWAHAFFTSNILLTRRIYYMLPVHGCSVIEIKSSRLDLERNFIYSVFFHRWLINKKLRVEERRWTCMNEHSVGGNFVVDI